MSDDSGPAIDGQQTAAPLSNQRILVILVILGAGGAILGTFMVSFRFGLGILIGTAIAFANYFWLKRSVRKIFSAGEKPRYLAAKYFLRYLLLGLAVAAIYAVDAVPFTALMLGLAGIGFAVMIEGFIRIFTSIFSEKEIL